MGLHARPAAVFVQLANKFRSEILLEKDGHEVNGKSIMSILTLAAETGSDVKVSVSGPDCVEAINAIEELFVNQFGE